MTSNQINNRRQGEEARANRVNEKIGAANASSNRMNATSNRMNARTNRAGYKEQARHNKASEGIETAKAVAANIAASGQMMRGIPIINDPAWYLKNPSLASDVGQVNFLKPAGLPISFKTTTSGGHGQYDQFNVSGVMKLAFIPTIGGQFSSRIAGTEPNGITVAMRNLYAFVRHANSGHANYDAPDLMLYVIAVGSIYARIASLIRIYGLAYTYQGQNRWLGDAMIRVLGYNPVDVRKNLADLRFQINKAITMVQSFVIPNNMSFIARWCFLNSVLIADGTVAKTQFYVYKQVKFLRYNEEEGRLDYKQAWGYDKEHTAITSEVTELMDDIAVLMGSEDCGIMSGDILKAYGSAGVYAMQSLSEDYTIKPIHDDLTLSQLRNTTILGNPHSYNEATVMPRIGHGVDEPGPERSKAGTGKKSSNEDIPTFEVLPIDCIGQNPNTGLLMYGNSNFKWDQFDSTITTPLYHADVNVAKFIPDGHIIDINYDNPGVGDVLEVTRNTVTVKYDTVEITTPSGGKVSGAGWYLNNFGTEIVIGARIFYDIQKVETEYGDVSGSWLDGDALSTASSITLGYRVSHFTCRPKYFIYTTNFISLSNRSLWIGDFDNYCFIDGAVLAKLHEAAVISEFAVPEFGSSR